MYYYFSSDYPSAIKLGGAFLGLIGNTVKSVNICGDSPPFIEVCPLGGKQKQINFMLNEDFLSAPPDNTIITDLKGGYLIKFTDSLDYFDFCVIAQKRSENALITVFTDGSSKISIETKSDFFVENIKMKIDSALIDFFILNGEQFVSVHIKNQAEYLVIFHLGKTIRKVFFKQVESFSIKDTLITNEKLTDIAKHVVNCSWEFSEGSFKSITSSISSRPDFSPNTLHERILPFAFLEELLVGGDISDYLSDGMKKNADKLLGFFGKFTGVMPPPTFRETNQIGLIYSSGKNKYNVSYFSFSFEKGKIDNIISED